MKKIIITLIAAVLMPVGSLFAQDNGSFHEIPCDSTSFDDFESNNPTINVKRYKPLKCFDFKVVEYLKYNFVERKELYIGKPLSELLKDCELPIKSLLPLSTESGVVMYDATYLHFESERVTNYRRRVQRALAAQFLIEFQPILSYPEVDRLGRLYGDDWTAPIQAYYEKQIVKNIRAFGKNFSELPPVQMKPEVVTTPCCAPEPMAAATPSEATTWKKTRAELNYKFNLLDSITFVQAHTTYYYKGSYYWGYYTKKIFPNCDTTLSTDTISLATMFDLAKNSYQIYSTMLSEFFKQYLGNETSYTLIRTPLKSGIPRFISATPGCNAFQQTFQTIPTSPYGWYKFTAPSGYDFFSFINNRYLDNLLTTTESFFIAYDGSVYCLHITDEKRNFTTTYPNGTSYTYNQLVADEMLALNTSKNRTLFTPLYADVLTLKWGFINGSRLLDEFLDVFRRLYNEGNGFSKEDAYNAAFAYILEGRGIELYRRAPSETTFKRYNTTPIYNSNSKKIVGFHSTIWQ